MSTLPKPTWLETPPVYAQAEAPVVQPLLEVQRGFHCAGEDEPSPPVEPKAPEPELMTPANLRAFYLLRKNASEAYLNQFRQMRGRLLRKREAAFIQGRELRTLLVTSPEEGDGKTFVSLNLALMMAVAPGCRVLLVDLNVDHPAFHARMLLPEAPGAREAMAGTPWKAAARKVPHMDLFVLCRGRQDHGEMEPVNYPLFRAWLADVRKQFDWVVVDGPALNSSPDAEILSHYADGTLMVVRAGVSEFGQMDEAVGRIERAKLVGAVFNGRG
jgi:Mrp family chromosome partitioning ATPase